MWVVKSRPVGVAREGRAQEDAHGVRIAPQRQTEALRGPTAPGGRQTATISSVGGVQAVRRGSAGCCRDSEMMGRDLAWGWS